MPNKGTHHPSLNRGRFRQTRTRVCLVGLALTPPCGCHRHCKWRHILKTKLTSRSFPRKPLVNRKRRLLCWHSSSELLPSLGKKLSTPRTLLLAVDKPPRKLAEFVSEKHLHCWWVSIPPLCFLLYYCLSTLYCSYVTFPLHSFFLIIISFFFLNYNIPRDVVAL